MMVHRHQEGDVPGSAKNMTKLNDVKPHSDSTDPNDPLYVPVVDVEDKTAKKTGRPKKKAE